MPAALRRQYVKLCDPRDFDDSRLQAAIADVVPGRAAEQRVERKLWEFGLLALFLDDVRRLHDGTEALAVGAGREVILFWLANRVGRVLATDIYGEGDFSHREADAAMLADPSTLAPYPYRRERLEVRRMDARRLELADESFDVVFSLSSIEHFGSPAQIGRAAAEMGRVLRPGGHAFIVTECFVRRSPLDRPRVHNLLRIASRGRLAAPARADRRAVDAFTPAEIGARIVAPSGLHLLQPPDFTLSRESLANVATFRGGGEPVPATGHWHPHVAVRARIGSPWTSMALALQKPCRAPQRTPQSTPVSGPQPGPATTS
jgi:SAM-dependent methyltransferase